MSLKKWRKNKGQEFLCLMREELKELMERITPDYYDKFTCIADKCPITCCQEWKIAVDADTNRRWKKIMPPEDVTEQKKNLSAYTTHKDGTRVIGLDENHQCPFLSSDKLCRLVCTYGDKVLSETCTIFPREVHRFDNHEEATLVPCCPAVIDLWKEKADFPTNNSQIRLEKESLLFSIRDRIIEMIQNEEQPVEDALLQSFYIMLELYNGGPSEDLVQEYFSEDTLKQLQEAIFKVELPELDTFEECNELLLDVSENYRKEGLYKKYLDPVTSLAERISEEYDENEMLDKWTAFKKEFSQYDQLIRNFLENEMFSDLVMPDGNLEQMVIQMQWIAMEYTVIRQSIFLKWMQDGCKKLIYETVRDYLVIITRMTGYDEEDIYEYLENSFESLIWDWGYFALIVGKDNDL